MQRIIPKLITISTYPGIMGILMTMIVYEYSAVLSLLFPQVCWLPRVGGLFVGISVIIQGYISANREAFETEWLFRLTREQAYTHFSYAAAAIGTLFWAFGDLMPSVLWFENATCRALAFAL